MTRSEENLGRVVKAWADPMRPEDVEAARRRFLESVREEPAPSRPWGIATVAAALLIAGIVFVAIVSPGDPGTPSGQEDKGKPPEFVRVGDMGVGGALAAWSPDGKRIALYREKTLWVHDSRTWKVMQYGPLEAAQVMSLAWHPSGKWIGVTACSTLDALQAGIIDQILAIDAADLTKRTAYRSGLVAGLGFLDGDRIACASRDGAIVGITPGPGMAVHDLVQAEKGVVAIAGSPDGRWIGVLGNRIEVFDAKTRTRRALMEPRSATAGKPVSPMIVFSPDSRLMAVEGETGTVILYETANWKEVHRWVPNGRDIAQMQFTPDSRYLVTQDPGSIAGKGMLQAWRITSDWKYVASIEIPAFAHAILSPTDDRIAVNFLPDPKAEAYRTVIYRLRQPE
jgi:WD40 repeat protein